MDSVSRPMTRRRFLHGATATTGALVAGTYVKPSMRSLGVPAAYAAVSAPPVSDETDKATALIKLACTGEQTQLGGYTSKQAIMGQIPAQMPNTGSGGSSRD